MNDLWDEVIRLDGTARTEMPDSGQFASTRETQSFIEKMAIEEVLDWLSKNHGWATITEIQQPDPPDAIISLADGMKIWCEFASVTHQKAIEAIKHRQKNNSEIGLYQDWTPAAFQACVTELVASKDAKFAKHLKSGRVRKPLLLVLGSDSTMSHTGLLDGLDIRSSIFDVIAIHLGYSPTASPTENGDYLIHIVAGIDSCPI
jgi:hypothetical protein